LAFIVNANKATGCYKSQVRKDHVFDVRSGAVAYENAVEHYADMYGLMLIVIYPSAGTRRVLEPPDDSSKS
jgi:hypothetical protein